MPVTKFKPGDRVVDVHDGCKGTVTRDFIDNEECVWVEWDTVNPDDHDDGPMELWIREDQLVLESN